MYEQLELDFMKDYEEKGKHTYSACVVRLKKCSKCDEMKEATTDNFSRHPCTACRLDNRCKQCQNEKNRKLRKQIKLECGCKVLGCKEKKLANHSNCEYHAIYKIINNQIKYGRFKQLKTKEQKKEFIKLLQLKLQSQDYKCAITGVPIELGVNISLDHIISVSKGGSCEVENLQWVERKANSSKGTN